MRKTLIVGSGAREHALAKALSASGAEILVAPGNAGTASLGRNVAVKVDDVSALVDLAVAEAVDLVVVGPELPLTLGLVDALASRGVLAFGPSKAGARLEGSKAFMKGFLARHAIPTADFVIMTDPDRAEAYVRAANRPLVIKADGLCAGKGVVVASSVDEGCRAIQAMMRDRDFGEAGSTVIIEEVLRGEEASFHVITDGTRIVALPAAQDHKRIFDGDRGPNTGGMGAYAPAPVVTPELHARVMREIIEPTLRGMAAEGAPFRGVLFAGLMIDEGDPRVLEFNVRFGDPEATVLVPMMDADWFALLSGAARGDIGEARVSTKSGAALAVVMAAEGYPGTPRTGDEIAGLQSAWPEGVSVFHAGTKRREDGAIVTAGGRILAVVAQADSLQGARDGAYRCARQITWPGEQHRGDIGWRVLGPT
jgi:phosphoribosylamine--glycine ligase